MFWCFALAYAAGYVGFCLGQRHADRKWFDQRIAQAKRWPR